MKQTIIFFKVFLFLFLPIQGLTGEAIPYRLDNIVVTATRTESRLQEIPANVSIITKEEMEEKGVHTLTDFFENESGVFTKNLFNSPKFSTIDIRGYGETAAQNSLFLIDGRRINDISMSGADLMQIPMEMIDRVEIYRGPATVLYGDNAIGGVINIILKKGEGKPTIKAGINTGSYDLYNPYASAYGKEGKFGYYLLTSSYDTSGYRHNNGLHARDIIGHFSFDISKQLELNLKIGHHKDIHGMPGPLNAGDFAMGYDRRDSKTPDDVSSTEDNFLDLETRINFDEDISLSLGGAYRNRHTSFHYVTEWGPWDSMRQVETFSLTPKVIVKKKLFSLKNTLVCGMDYYYNPTRSNDVGTGTSSATNINKTEYGFYLNNEVYLLKNLLFNTGYRITRAKYDFDYVDHTGISNPINDHLWKEKEAYSIGANYIFRENGNIFLNYTKGFRLPATDEYFNIYGVPPINESLEPHEVKEIDIGIRWNFLKNMGGSLTFFSGKHRNEIFYNPLTFANENYEKTKREGLEASFFYLITENIKLNLSYSNIKAKFDGGVYDGNDVPLVPTHKFSGKIGYMWNNLAFTFSSTYVGERYMVSDVKNVFRTLSGAVTYDFNILYKYKGIRATAGIKNITDKEYSEYGVVSNTRLTRNYYPSAGRQYMVGFEYTY